MKIRNGFVSNSSSSSFMIAWKGDLKQELDKAFQVKDDFPIKSFSKISECFINSIDKKEFLNGMTLQDVADYFGDDDDEDPVITQLKSWIDAGYKVASGSFADDNDGIEIYLCNTDINWDKENLKIIHQGGY